MKKIISLTVMLMCFTCYMFAERIPEGIINLSNGKWDYWSERCDGITDDGFLYQILDYEEIKEMYDDYSWAHCYTVISTFFKYGELDFLLHSKEIPKEKFIKIIGVIDEKIPSSLVIPEQIEGYNVISLVFYAFHNYGDYFVWNDVSCNSIIIPATVLDIYCPSSLCADEVLLLRDKNQLMYINGLNADYFYINDGEKIPLKEGKIHRDYCYYSDTTWTSCDIGSNWEGFIVPEGEKFRFGTQGLEEINNYTFYWNSSRLEIIFFPTTLKTFNGTIVLPYVSYDDLRKKGLSTKLIRITKYDNLYLESGYGEHLKNVKFAPGSIRFEGNEPVTINACSRAGLAPEFIEYLKKQNYPFDKE